MEPAAEALLYGKGNSSGNAQNRQLHKAAQDNGKKQYHKPWYCFFYRQLAEEETIQQPGCCRRCQNRCGSAEELQQAQGSKVFSIRF